MSNVYTRRIDGSPIYQGTGETVAYTLDTTRWGSSPSSPAVTVLDADGDDVSETVLTGSASVSGNVITTPAVSSLTASARYLLQIQFVISGNTLVSWSDLYGQPNPLTYFTYDLTTTTGKIRLEIGDTDNSDDAGVKPDGSNFSDVEINYFYTQENSDVRAGAARACEILARMWAGASENTRIREYQIDTTKKAEHYLSVARTLREQTGSRYISGSAPIIKSDGYSADVNSRKNDATTGDYGGEVITIRTR